MASHSLAQGLHFIFLDVDSASFLITDEIKFFVPAGKLKKIVYNFALVPVAGILILFGILVMSFPDSQSHFLLFLSLLKLHQYLPPFLYFKELKIEKQN